MMMMIMEHKQKQQWIEQEDIGENSPSLSLSPSSRPPVPVFGALRSLIADIKTDIYARLLETGNQEAVNNPNFLDALDAHFRRLPPSYALDLNVEKSEDVLMHQKILEEAKDPEKCPVFHVQFLKVNRNGDHGIDLDPCSKLGNLKLDVKKNSKDSEDGNILKDFGREHVSRSFVHEIIFSTLDKPKLLSQLSALLSDLGLNIREAHVFCTNDGYSLDVFVVDGWSPDDTDGLRKALNYAIVKNEQSWSGSACLVGEEGGCTLEKPDSWKINMRMLNMGEKIGSGSCGDLYRGIYAGQDVAVKVLRSEHSSEAVEVEFEREVSVLRQVQHRNVVRFIGACTKPPQLCIVTEYMRGGNLYDFLHKHHNVLELPQVVKFAVDVCKGMEYIHRNNIIHRDLKTANLLMDTNKVVKVADFGVARVQNHEGVMTGETGTYRWMAPEVINHQPYDEKADVFSFAIVLWELATSKVPYDTMTPVQAALGVRQGLRPEIPENLHPRLVDLMQRCWEADPAGRPFFSEVVAELDEFLRQLYSNGQGRRALRKASKRIKEGKDECRN